jgi:8-amino-3,8-dideoxy-alpha-D-manno-octulosonate transaminase
MPGFELINEEEKNAVNKLFEDGGVLFPHGFDALRKNYHVREFEELSTKYFNCEHSLAVSSGTAAIKIGLKAIGVKPGDEVITQAFNFIATIEAILDCGAKPVIANVDETLNMDLEDCAQLITDKTKAILPVHMLGVPVDMNRVMEISNHYKIKVLEDNCESVGGKYDDKFLGTIGHCGVFSFDFGKAITTGEGGMVLTNEAKIDKYSREYHDHGHENNPKFPRGKDTKSIFGFNYRMTEMQAVIGKVQLGKLDFIIKSNDDRYNEFEKNFPDDIIKRKIPSLSTPLNDTFIFFVESSEQKEKYIEILNNEGFGTKNLPDAMEWHCSAYWEHALDENQVKRTMKTKKLLEKAIAVPIWLKRSPRDYFELSKKLFGS